MKRKFSLVFILLFVLTGLSCSSEKKEKPVHLSDYKQSALKYMPLNLGNKWLYNVNYFGSSGQIEIQITATDGEWFIDSKGGRLMADRRGIRDSSRYILMFPLQREAWVSIIDSKSRELRKTTGVDETVKVPAGVFEGAVKVQTVIELPGNKNLHSFHYFVANVGIVKIETVIEDINEGKMLPQTVTELVSYSIKDSKN